MPSIDSVVKPKRTDLSAIDGLEHELRSRIVEPGEVEVGGEPAGVARPELAYRRPALQRNAHVEQALVGQMEREVILGDIDESRSAPAASALIVASEIALGDHGARTSSPVESTTSKALEWRPARSRGPR